MNDFMVVTVIPLMMVGCMIWWIIRNIFINFSKTKPQEALTVTINNCGECKLFLSDWCSHGNLQISDKSIIHPDCPLKEKK